MNARRSPHLVDVEVASAWRRLAAAGHLDDRRARLALDDLASLRLERVPHGPLFGRSWDLRDNLTMDDAVYVVLAELLGFVLLTAHAKLAGSVGHGCTIELLRGSGRRVRGTPTG